MVVDPWSTHVDMQLRDDAMAAQGGWPSDTRGFLHRVADLLGTYLIIAVCGVAALIALKLLGVPIS